MKRWVKILIIAGAVILAIRIALPFIIVGVANRVLDDLEGYTGHVKDVDLRLIRGAYRIDSLVIMEEEGAFEVPFVSIPLADISVQWNALFKGAIVGRLILTEPELNFTLGQDSTGKKTEQYGEGVDWPGVLRGLMPFRVNRFEIVNGDVYFRDLTRSIPVDLYLEELHLEALNLSNLEETGDELPAELNITATSIGGGELNLDVRADILKEIPDIDLDLEFEGVDLAELNEILMEYGKIDVERGEFFLYSEFKVESGQMEGYVRPVIENLKVVDWDREQGGFFRKLWESVAGIFTEAVENQPKDRLATQVPVSGSLRDSEVGILASIWNIFRNGFVEAFEKSIEGSITPDE